MEELKHAPVTLVLLLVTIAFSLAGFNNRDFFDRFKFSPYAIIHNNEWWRIVTGGFLHSKNLFNSPVAHLLMNMASLFFIGPVIEILFKAQFGPTGIYYYLGLYLGGIIFSDVYDLQQHKDNPLYSAIGASGAISSLLFCLLMLAPWEWFSFFFIPMPGIIFAVLFTVGSIYAARRGRDNIGHTAHVSGAVFGIIFMLLFFPHAGRIFINQLMQGPHPLL